MPGQERRFSKGRPGQEGRVAAGRPGQEGRVATGWQDFRITPVKSGFNTIRLHWSKTGTCSVLTLGTSLGLIIFTVLIRKSEKQWKVLRDCMKKIPMGILAGHQSDDSWEFPRVNFSRQSLRTFHCLYQSRKGGLSMGDQGRSWGLKLEG